MRAAGIEPDLPPAPAPYLIDWLFEVGPTAPAGMSVGPIGWQDIAAWSRLSAQEPMPWEARLLRRLSTEYVNETHRAEKPDCPAPWAPTETIDANRDAVSRKVAGAFRALVAAQSKGTP